MESNTSNDNEGGIASKGTTDKPKKPETRSTNANFSAPVTRRGAGGGSASGANTETAYTRGGDASNSMVNENLSEEERRIKIRLLPDGGGFQALNRAEIKSDLEQARQFLDVSNNTAGSQVVAANEYQDPTKISSIVAYNPPVPTESTAEYKKRRWDKWLGDPALIQSDLAAYKGTVQRTLVELNSLKERTNQVQTVNDTIQRLLIHKIEMIRDESALLDTYYENMCDEYPLLDLLSHLKDNVVYPSTSASDMIMHDNDDEIFALPTRHKVCRSILPKTKVKTAFGNGTVLEIRDNQPSITTEKQVYLPEATVVVQLEYGKAYVKESEIVVNINNKMLLKDRWEGLLDACKPFAYLLDERAWEHLYRDDDDDDDIQQPHYDPDHTRFLNGDENFFLDRPLPRDVLQKLVHDAIFTSSPASHNLKLFEDSIHSSFAHREQLEDLKNVLQGDLLRLESRSDLHSHYNTLQTKSSNSSQDRLSKQVKLHREMIADLASMRERLFAELTTHDLDPERVEEQLGEFLHNQHNMNLIRVHEAAQNRKKKKNQPNTAAVAREQRTRRKANSGSNNNIAGDKASSGKSKIHAEQQIKIHHHHEDDEETEQQHNHPAVAATRTEPRRASKRGRADLDDFPPSTKPKRSTAQRR